jgi:type IV pilus assembly protein PilN
MIRINLLPIQATRRRQTIQHQLLGAAAAVIVTIVICIVWTAIRSSEAEEKKSQIAEKQQELTQLDKIIGEVNEFTTKKKELEEKLQIIETLRKGKTGPVRALDDLATEIPNRVWLEKMNEASGAVTLEGVAIDHEDVSAFMKSLQKSKYFKSIVLSFSKQQKDKSGVNLYEFKITCQVNYSA